MCSRFRRGCHGSCRTHWTLFESTYTWFLWGHYEDDEVPHDFRVGPIRARMHVDHCIETIGDVTPMLFLDDITSPLNRSADFSTHHKCRNFDKIQDWAVSHGVEGWTPEKLHGLRRVVRVTVCYRAVLPLP
ncbi:hypothetical protein F4818DRAFT_141698 [Hypoxylon cercidicola]|nr:hypothetical protein F4818DRAFT_141698 [Hypoxylon cercidicola]